MNISSIIVTVDQEIEEIVCRIEEIEGCEVHLQDKQKGIIIASIEAQEISQEIKILEKINALEGVIEANMHYSYSEDELDKAREAIKGEISEVLDDHYPIESIRYNGSISTHIGKK